MKKALLIFAVFCISAIGLRAQNAKSGRAYSATVDFTYGTQYVFRGVQAARDTFFPSVEISAGPATVGIWSAQPLAGGINQEIDFYAGYGMVFPGGWLFNAGACLYYYPERDTGMGEDRATFEPYIGLSGSMSGFAPGAYVYYDTTLEALTLEGSLGYSVALESVGTSLDFSAVLGRADPEAGRRMTYYRLGVAVPFAISATGKLTVGINYTHNNIPGGDRYGRNGHFDGSLGISMGF